MNRDALRGLVGLAVELAGGVLAVAAFGLAWPPPFFATGVLALTVGAFVAWW